jgi:Na+-translocating ferredoxin:NAD+ oxidoreductase RnfD subunit
VVTVAASRRQASYRLGRFARTPKGLLIGILLVLVAVTAPGATGGAARAWLVVAVAAGVAAGIDLLSMRARGWHLRLPDGALLTGAILGMILDPSLPLPTIAAVATGAVVIKHLVRTRRGHVFNPAALALVGAGLLGVKAQSWWGVAAAPWYVIMPLLVITGLFITDRVNRLPMVGVFLTTYYGVLAAAAFTGAASRVAEAYHPPFVNAALFATLIMLTDPPTSPGRRTEQHMYALVSATVSVACIVTVRELYFLPLGLLAGNVWLATVPYRQRLAAKADPPYPSTAVTEPTE